LRVEDAERFVRVVMHARLKTAADVERLLANVEGALGRTTYERVLFDYRGIESHPEEVREAMWTWATKHPKLAIALVVDSEMTRVGTNMTALSRRVRLRAFMDEDEARKWLREPPRRTREIPQM